MAASWPPGSVSGQVRAQRDDDCSQVNHPQNEDIYLHPFSLCRWGGVPCAGGLGCTLCLCQAAGAYLVPARRALRPSMLHVPCAHPWASPCSRRKHRSQREMPKRVRHPLCRRTPGSGPLNLVPVPFPLGYHSPHVQAHDVAQGTDSQLSEIRTVPFVPSLPPVPCLLPGLLGCSLASSWVLPGCGTTKGEQGSAREAREQPRGPAAREQPDRPGPASS